MSRDLRGGRLFTPLRLGPIELRNRSIRAAAFEGMAGGHRCSQELIEYHLSVARGGVGMTTVAYAAVDRSGLSFSHQLLMSPDAVPGLRRLTDAVHAEGARTSIQLGHTGNMAKRAVTGERPMAPSARFNAYGPTWPRAMSSSDIARIVARFGEAVSLAREAGFDAVEIHAGHGYLISQFLSPLTNRRRDEYGGALADRMRFARAVMSEVRRVAGRDLAVLVKMNLRDGFPGGLELDEAVEVARMLEEEGADALVLSGGFVSRAPMYILRGRMPTRVMGEIMSSATEHSPPQRLLGLGTAWFGQALVPAVPFEENYFLADARVVRRAVAIPLVYVGGAVSRSGIEAVLAAGMDGVAMARALIREPDFVRRLKEEEASSSPCDHCNYCSARIYGASMQCHHVVAPPPRLARLLSREMSG